MALKMERKSTNLDFILKNLLAGGKYFFFSNEVIKRHLNHVDLSNNVGKY